MFGWFKPSCPCDPAAKAWIEERLHWLYDEFPDNIFTTKRMILPEHRYFPDKFDGGDDGVSLMFDRVCNYMDVELHQVQLEFVNDFKDNLWLVNEAGHELGQAVGTFSQGRGKSIIRIDRAGFGKPMDLVGTIAHELAHVRLLAEGRYHADAYDNELLTDLTALYLGFGIFLANSPRNMRSQDSLWPNTKLRKPEYLSAPMFGWAMAHVAWHNHEGWPEWAAHLKLDTRTNMKQGLKYLRATEDSSFTP